MRPETLDKTFRACVILCCLLAMSEEPALSSEEQICNVVVPTPKNDDLLRNGVADGNSDPFILEISSPLVLVLGVAYPGSDLTINCGLIATKSDDEIDEWLDEILSYNGDPVAKSDDEIDEWLDEILSYNGDPVAKSDDEIDEWLDEILSLMYPGSESVDCGASPGVIFLLGGDEVSLRIFKHLNGRPALPCLEGVLGSEWSYRLSGDNG